MVGSARGRDGTMESAGRVGIEAGGLEGLERDVGAVGRQGHVGEPAALLQPVAALGTEGRILDDAQNLEIVSVENHEMVGSAELLLEDARLDLEAEPLLGTLGSIDAIG